MRADTTSIRRAHRDSTAKDIGATTLQSMNHQIERAGRRALLRIDLLQAQWARAVPLQPFSKTIVVLCMATWKAHQVILVLNFHPADGTLLTDYKTGFGSYICALVHR
mmetsp:Transcript_21594/g.65544  ORF Transcript_21594/g.65544 Transcript_21594/m.65544 type:complete len:108 (+) Transcript_21594:253-576(+)